MSNLRNNTNGRTKAAPARSATKMGRLAPSLFTALGAAPSRSLYLPKEAVYRQGESADAVFYVENGQVQISVESELGKVGIIAVLASGAFFGEACLSGQPLYLASAFALANSVVCRIEKEAMVRVLREQPPLAAAFTAFLVTRNLQIEADLVGHLFSSSEQRLARLLLFMANFAKEAKTEKVIPMVNQQMLAARIGTTRPRINGFMNKFRKLGLVEYSGRELKVHSSLLSVIVHD
jgi:CRP-like cAMP-binding protein